jgi:hypothetical protein
VLLVIQKTWTFTVIEKFELDRIATDIERILDTACKFCLKGKIKQINIHYRFAVSVVERRGFSDEYYMKLKERNQELNLMKG